MAGAQRNFYIFDKLLGRDGYSTCKSEQAPGKAVEALNVEPYRQQFCKRRNGSSDGLTGTTGYSGIGLYFLGRHVPGNDPGAAELWAFDQASPSLVSRLSGTTWTTPTLLDSATNAAGQAINATALSFNGKYYLAYKSGQDRLHVWDGTTVRRAGLGTPAAATVADTGGGTYAATLRYYKVAYAVLSGATVLRQSELSASVSFTPSGAGTAARVTKPATITEGETHWLLYGSADNAVFYLLATTAVGTTTYDDSTAPVNYSGTLAPLAGTHTNWTSVKYLAASDDHILGAGSWESGGKGSRVWWSGVSNQTGVGAEEETTIQTTSVANYVDLDESDGGDITGFGGPIDGRILVFKRNQVWRLVPTGLDEPFYKPVPIYKGSGIGAIRQQTIITAEDENGRPAVYWLSEQGPYRIGADGPQCLVDDVQDEWDATVFSDLPSQIWHGVYYKGKRQIWWWDSTSPGRRIKYDIRRGRPDDAGRVRGGWFKDTTGAGCSAYCSVMFSNTVGATMSRDLVPYVGTFLGSPAPVLVKCDDSATDREAGNALFQSYVELPPVHLAGLGRKCSINPVTVVLENDESYLSVTLLTNYNETTIGPQAVNTVGTLNSDYQTIRCDGLVSDSCSCAAIRIGDVGLGSANNNIWGIHAVIVPWEPREDE